MGRALKHAVLLFVETDQQAVVAGDGLGFAGASCASRWGNERSRWNGLATTSDWGTPVTQARALSPSQGA